MHAELFGRSSAAQLAWAPPPPRAISFQKPFSLRVHVTVVPAANCFLTIRLLTVEHRPHPNRLNSSDPLVISVAQTGIYQFDDLVITRPSEAELLEHIEQQLLDEMTRTSSEMNDLVHKSEQCKQQATEELDNWRNTLSEVVLQVEASTVAATTVLLSQPVVDSGDPQTEIDIVEVSQCEGRGGDRLWMLLGEPVAMVDDQPVVRFVSQSWSSPAEVLRCSERVIIIRVPEYSPNASPAEEAGETHRVDVLVRFEQSGRHCRPVGFSYVSSLPSISREVIFEFAASGDPFALVAPAAQLLPATDEHGCTAFHIAAKQKQSFALKNLLNALRNSDRQQETLNTQNDRGQTALHCAVRSGDADSVHYLVSAGASRSIPDCNANTAVHYLGDAYNDAIYKDILDPPEHAEHLDLGARNDHGQTAVHMAVKRLKLSLLESLLEAGAPVDVADDLGQTPLHAAVVLNDLEIVITLLQKGADANSVAKDGQTALHMAVEHRNPEMIYRLLEAGADPGLSCEGYSDENVVERPDRQVQSVRELIADDDLLLSVIQGHWQLPTPPSHTTTNHLENNNNNNSEQYDNDEEQNGLDEAIGGVDEEEEESVSASSTRRMQDDVSSLDYLTRLRLAKVLDTDEKWTKLAVKLHCEHMIEFIKVCCEDGSPTMILLDQYEQMPNSNISSVITVMQDLGEGLAVKLLNDRFVPNRL